MLAKGRQHSKQDMSLLEDIRYSLSGLFAPASHTNNIRLSLLTYTWLSQMAKPQLVNSCLGSAACMSQPLLAQRHDLQLVLGMSNVM